MLRVHTTSVPWRGRLRMAIGTLCPGWRLVVPEWADAAAAAIDRRLSQRRIRAYSAICLLVWVTSLTASVVLGHPPRNALNQPLLPDYLAHWTGGRLLLDGASDRLYDAPTQQLLQDQAVGLSDSLSWYVNPPFTALFYLPLAALPYLPSAVAWTALGSGLLLASARLMRPILPRLGRTRWGLVLLAAAATPPVYELMGSGQDSALSLLLWVAGIRLALARRDGLAGAVFALGLYKPQLFFLPPLLLLCWWRLRAVLGWVLAASGLAAISLLLLGPEGVRSWLMLTISPAYREAVQGGQAWKMLTIPALLTGIAPVQLASAAEAVGLLLGALLVLAFVRCAVRARRAAEGAIWGLAGLTTLLASPHLALYDLVLGLPSALLLVEERNERPVRLALLAILLLTWTLALRHTLVAALPWPLTALGVAWTPLPLVVLWLASARLAREAGTAG